MSDQFDREVMRKLGGLEANVTATMKQVGTLFDKLDELGSLDNRVTVIESARVTHKENKDNRWLMWCAIVGSATAVGLELIPRLIK